MAPAMIPLIWVESRVLANVILPEGSLFVDVRDTDFDEDDRKRQIDPEESGPSLARALYEYRLENSEQLTGLCYSSHLNPAWIMYAIFPDRVSEVTITSTPIRNALDDLSQAADFLGLRVAGL
jgi:hypothetical protein